MSVLMATRTKPLRFIAGLDVGQQSDPTALILLERQIALTGPQFQPRFDCRYLERVPLQTPYPAMVRGVRERLSHLGEPCTLVIDATGVGRATVDLFREGWTEYDASTLVRTVLPGRPIVIAITLTGGADVREAAWDEWHVPKRDVVTALVVALQQGCFRVAKALPEAATLVREARNFQWKVSKTGQDLYGAWREGQHDDLLLAAAIGVWWGQRTAMRPRPRPLGEDDTYRGERAWMG
jgi:hypothetical protein